MANLFCPKCMTIKPIHHQIIKKIHDIFLFFIIIIFFLLQDVTSTTVSEVMLQKSKKTWRNSAPGLFAL